MWKAAESTRIQHLPQRHHDVARTAPAHLVPRGTGGSRCRGPSTCSSNSTASTSLLPELTDAAAAERAAHDLNFDPAAVARAQLTWMVTARMPNINDTDSVAGLMAEDYGLRFRVRPDQVAARGHVRARTLSRSGSRRGSSPTTPPSASCSSNRIARCGRVSSGPARPAHPCANLFVDVFSLLRARRARGSRPRTTTAPASPWRSKAAPCGV